MVGGGCNGGVSIGHGDEFDVGFERNVLKKLLQGFDHMRVCGHVYGLKNMRDDTWGEWMLDCVLCVCLHV